MISELEMTVQVMSMASGAPSCLLHTTLDSKPQGAHDGPRHRLTAAHVARTSRALYLDNVTLEKANLSMAYMENALIGPDSHEDCSFAPAVTLEGHGCPKPSMGM